MQSEKHAEKYQDEVFMQGIEAHVFEGSIFRQFSVKAFMGFKL
jgi:hypothetical protein